MRLLSSMGRMIAAAGLGVALLAAGLLMPHAGAQLATTTVQGTVYRADGSVASGTLLVSWPAFSTAMGQSVAAGSVSAAISSNGFVSLNLAPNSGAYPAETYYTAVYHLSDGTVSREYWVVPATASTTISSVRAQLAPATVAVQPVSKSYVDSSIAAITGNYVPLAGGTMSGPLELSGDPVAGNQAATKHYADVLAASELPLAGGSMSGALNTPDSETKLPRVDVRHPDFGTGCPNAADATGVKDSTCAIQAAITWAENNAQGGSYPPVYFAPGNYKVSGDITDDGSIQYYADNATLTIVSGAVVSIGNQVFRGATLLPGAINAPATGPVDALLFNPARSHAYIWNSVIGHLSDYTLSGTIPNTATYNSGQINHFADLDFVMDTTPGCWGFSGTCYNTEHGARNLSMYVNGGGGTNVETMSANFFSVGDHIGYENYINSFGGSIDGGGPEGTKGMGLYVNEPANTWTGAVVSGSAGAGQTTITADCSSDCGSQRFGIAEFAGDPGAGTPASLGQGLIVTDEQNATASGQIISVAGGSGETLGTITVNITSGLSDLVASTCEATLNSDLNPTPDPTGSGTQTLTFTVTDVSGVCTAGGLMSFTGSNHEQALITNVTAESGGQQTITANVGHVHESGSYIIENANSDAGMFADIAANDTGSLEFPFEIVGIQSISGNTAVMWWRWWYGGSPQSYPNFPYGRMNLGKVNVSSLSNSGGTVTFRGVSQYNAYLANQSAIYISDASNSAFDGPCTGVSSTVIAGTLTCTQAASTGQTATSAIVTLTDPTLDNPYGNSRVNFYPGAAIVDPQDGSPSAAITVNGVRNEPVDGRQFQVEANEMPLNAGDKLVEHHSTAQFHGIATGVNVQNPVQYLVNGVSVNLTNVNGNGGSDVNNYAFSAANNVTASQFSYFGGSLAAPNFADVVGMFGDTLHLRQPPQFGDYVIRSSFCPPAPSSCVDPGYMYGLYYFQGNGGANYAQYFPSTNTMQWSGLQQFNSGVGVGGPLTGAEINGEVTVDGSTYTTVNAAWNAAVGLANSSGKDQTVRLGPGTFNVSATMMEPSNGACVNLVGSAGSTVNADSGAATTLTVPASLGGDVFYLGNAAQAQGCTFRDLVLLANANATHGFEMQWFRGLLMENVTVNDTTSDGIVLGEESTTNGHQSNFLLRNVTVSYSASAFTPASRPGYGVHIQKTAIDSHLDDVVVRNALTAAVYNEGTGNTGYLVHGFGYPYTCATAPCVNNASSATAANASYATSYVIEDVGGGGSVWTDTYADSPSVAGFYIGANGVAIHGGHIQWPELASFPAANLAYVAAGVTNDMLIADVSCLGMDTAVNWITYAGPSGNPPTFSSVHNLTGCGNYVQDLNPAEVTAFSSGGANINDPSGAVPRVWATPIAAAASYPAYSAQLYTGYQGDAFQAHFSGIAPFFNVTSQGTIRSNGGIALSTIINTAATLTLTAANKNVIANAASGAQTITLPSCYTALPDRAAPTGLEFTIIKSDTSSNAVAVQTVSGQQINYQGVLGTSLSMTAPGKRTLVCAPDYNWYAY